MSPTLAELVTDFAGAVVRVDRRRPQFRRYNPGIGPHAEPDVVRLVLAEMQAVDVARYANAEREVPYPDSADRCDLCLGAPADWAWAIEIKAARAMRDNGTPAPEHVNHVLSLYPNDRSLIGDANKVLGFSPARRRAVLLYAYDYPDYGLRDLLPAVRCLLELRVTIVDEATAPFDGLVHPVHQRGRVVAWELAAAQGRDDG